jgi:hypothetical protein
MDAVILGQYAHFTVRDRRLKRLIASGAGTPGGAESSGVGSGSV